MLITAIGLVSCSKEVPEIEQEESQKTEEENDSTSFAINIKIGSQTFSATLVDNETAKAFKVLLPMSLTMNELNGNEKYCYLSGILPTSYYQPGTINAGDLLLYGSNCVVLFYETFSSSYSYTKIGKINNPSGLSAAVGTGNVNVSFLL